MFFIGIFGINEGHKPLGTYNNAICPSCGAYTRYEVFKTYSYFHIFFIPIFRWNKKYYVKSACCGTLYQLDPTIGSEFESGHNPDIRSEHLRIVHAYAAYNACSNCGQPVDSNFSFCPRCGKRL